VVALTRKVRSDRVRTPPRAEYRASRPLPLPLRFHSRFFAGGIQKRNGRQEAGAALPFQDSKKRKRAGFKYKWSLAMQNSLRNGEAQNLYALGPPSRPRAIIPAVLKKYYKTAGMAP